MSLRPNFCSSTVVFTLESLEHRNTIPALCPTIPPTFPSPYTTPSKVELIILPAAQDQPTSPPTVSLPLTNPEK